MTIEEAHQHIRNRRLGLLLIAAFTALFVGSVIYVMVFQQLVGA